ncbi:MAG TPA: cupin domain-containing protein [Egibacteraceae bacterium]|nr:cupin domain-containing protein [Egibacteraceae bacterium]
MESDRTPGEHLGAAVDGPRAVDLRDYVVFDLDGVAGRRVLATDVLAVDLLCLEPGQDVPPRTFTGTDVVYTVLGGVAWVVTDDAEVTLTPLQAVVIPAGVPHAVRNDSPDPLILQALVSPPDEVAAPTGQPLRPAAAQPREVRGGRGGRAGGLRRLLGGRGDGE